MTPVRATATATAAAPCTDGAGAWSNTVDGLRARLVTSEAATDRSGIRIVLEIENTSDAAVDLHWTGTLPHGFATFRLDDAAGDDAVPDWRLPGNAPGGVLHAVFRPKHVVTYVLHDGAFGTMTGKRVLRIGAFWGRELPADGSPRFLRGTITGGPAVADSLGYEGDAPVRTDAPRARTWTGILELRPVCIR